MNSERSATPVVPQPTPALDAARPVVERVEPWKGGVRAAYSLLHEDLVDASTGTLQVAVPALRTRGLRAGLATCVSLCSEASWTPLRALALEGFEIVNHGWWHEPPTLDKAKNEIDEARKELQRRTGSTVSFYASPDPEPDPEIAHHALKHGHLGCRDGRIPGGIVQPGHLDPLRIPHDSFGRASAHGPASAQLDGFLDSIIDQGGWGIRSMRGVSDTSWDPVPERLYVAHLDRLEGLARAKEVWIAPPSEILRHLLALQLAGTPVVDGALLHFPQADPKRRIRAFLSVVVRCSGQTPHRIHAEQNGVPVLSQPVGPGLWSLQVNPWDPAILDATPG